MPQEDWRPLGSVDHVSLRETRIQYHQAIQNVAAIGRNFLPTTAGDENASLTWIPGHSRLAGRWIQVDQIFRSSISFKEFSIFIVDRQVQTLAKFELEGATFMQSFIWLEEQIGLLGLDPTHLADAAPYEIPIYAYTSEPFKQVPEQELSYLANLYHNSYQVLKEIASNLSLDPQIITWPHHFDQAMIILLKETGHAETNTSITLGMSPGDENIDSPYLYVSTWPHVAVSGFAPLSQGYWIEEEWTGAVLQLKQLELTRLTKQTFVDFYLQAKKELQQKLLG